MKFLILRKNLTRICVLLVMAMIFSGCGWLRWPFKAQPNPRMLSALQKLDAISSKNDTINQEVARIDQKYFALTQQLDSIDSILSRMEATNITAEPVRASACVKAAKSVTPDAVVKEPAQIKTPVQPALPQLPEPVLRTSHKPSKVQKTRPVLTPKQKYAAAFEAYKRRKLSKALKGFKNFIKNHPSHNLADNSQYWIGEIYYDKKKYSDAIYAFTKVIKNYPDQGKAPAALLKLGYCCAKNKDEENAIKYLRQMVMDYPFSPLVGLARAKLAELQPLAKTPDSRLHAVLTE